jgi:hypothetical protein
VLKGYSLSEGKEVLSTPVDMSEDESMQRYNLSSP